MTDVPVPIPAVFMEPDDLNLPAVLDAALSGDERVRWEITNDGLAQWAMSKLAEAQARVADVESQAAEWTGRIARWCADQVKDDRSAVRFFEAHLTKWAHAQREANPKKATFKYVAGVIKTQSRQPVVEIEDQDAVVEWCKAHGHGELVRTRESVLVSELRKLVQIRDVVERSVVELQCGHRAFVDGQTTRGEMVRCPEPECESIARSVGHDGDMLVPVHEVLDEVLSSRVIPMLPLEDDDALPIPGTRVTPGYTNVSVQPDI